MLKKDIFKEGNLYIIRKEIDGELVDFGSFSSLEEAIDERDELEEYGWPFLKENPKNKFVEKYIYEDDGKYFVSKTILDVEIVYGVFDSLNKAKSLKRVLIENCWSLAPKTAKIKYSKYIIKQGKRFVIRKRFLDEYKFFGSFKNLDEAVNFRDQLIDENWGMSKEKVLENIDLIELKGENANVGKVGRSFVVFNFSKDKCVFYGYYSSLRSAIRNRDKLISNGWDASKLNNIIYSKEETKYIAKVGNLFRISKHIDGEIRHFGHYSTLDEAIEIRDKLISNGWDGESLGIDSSRKRPDFDRNINRINNQFCVIKRVDGELIVFDSFSTLSEAIAYRDYLEEHDWVIEEDENGFEEEKYDEYIYLNADGKYYLKNEIDGVMRIFGVFNDPLDAIAERLECIKNNWSSKSVPESEYFKNEFNAPNLDYSNSLTTYLEDEDVFDDESFYLSFPVTVGKSYKNKGWAVKRSYLDSFVPKIPYEKECTIFVEGIEIKGRLNIHTRLFYFTNEKLSSYLEKLSSIDPKTQAKVDLELSYGHYLLKDTDEDFITFTTTFSKSFKSGMFAMPRKFSKEILPILPYEEECIFSVGDVDASGKFNLEFRFLFNSDSIIPKLTSMKEDGEEIKVVLLLD